MSLVINHKITQAVVLSAGFGTRLREVTDNLKVPKVMVPLAGKPLLEHHIQELKRHGISEFFINLHYLPEAITDYFGDGSKLGVKIEYFLENPDILGTAGGIKNFEHELDCAFLVLYGDTFYGIDFSRLVAFWDALPGDAAGMASARATDHPHDSDLAVLGADGRITEFLLKPHSALPKEYWGTSAPYIFKKEVLQFVPAKQYYEIDHQLVPDLLSRGYPYYAYKLGKDEFRKDIGTPERYKEVEEYLKKRHGTHSS